MDVYELNDLLKTIINELIEDWGSVPGIRHKVSKILLGAHGQAAINKWLTGNRSTPFGIKPLTRIANLLGYDINLAFVKNENQKEINIIDNLNVDFVKELKSKIIDYLKCNVEDKKKYEKSILSTSQNNSVVNQVLGNLFDDQNKCMLNDNDDESYTI